MFPIVQPRHCYLICCDMKSSSVDIIDSAGDRVSIDNKYGKMPLIVRDMLVTFMKECGLENKTTRAMAKAKPKRLNMDWREAKSVFNYGIYTMRHMETYKGRGGRDWDCGLKPGETKQLTVLRHRYCHKIVTSMINELKDTNRLPTHEYDKKKK
ncbi:unnamed protein product [Cuscuta epithymum]|uniref:Uncharacterized protein n=1 Tax=Cuscuta epithymum TaxID=186058 RepID=A0AAV0GI99_9ASTE|nr:unnamed protein product [Cuscuta epithymum]CAH9114123.1 unnamed protein product [Cuscuta epithymum]CAH9147035.1 unnamed protein product [Cuscuta epithymum]CAH9147038.1 unnamed protein product [Cuscuta epithymum]